ncbi:SAM-dependent methyltransferase [Erythrobacter litoralis]|uniref:Cyclopropane-fatty-acyl-phospholipid synthase n=1 Tax=Erythrobacter litoralis (strain HTCC2594) TaxID=314225 RepID=Q2N9Z2_ERYLH|nr:cyclopropane-fatty-acyl-phospholipid synthase family protein [Erythrobacter litoralis]ABC63499.1 cyclopropane-fatty-acyl-phospholipid synthase [Erythrobacter litoralis HTCC2594]
MNAEGSRRGGGLFDAAQRFERGPGLLARVLAPGFRKVLDRIDAGLERGTMIGHLPDGTTRVLGGRAPGYEAEVHLHNWRALLRLATNGSIGWYQAWEQGEWESPDLVQVFALFGANASTLGTTARAKSIWQRALRQAHRLNANTLEGSQRNIRAHYDLGNDFYAAWLGDTMTYSSALFGRGGEADLDRAQHAKIDAVLDRLDLGEGETMLEIGCGWGTLAQAAAERGTRVDAISLSDEQLAWAREGASEQVQFLKQDYRDTDGPYDAVASVEMVEALGREFWPTYMDCIARNLKSGGKAALQFISMRDDLFEAYVNSADFIQAYIFPGGLLIRTSEFRHLAEKRGLAWQDQVDFGQDYAETLRLWRENFNEAVRQGRLPEGFDARFVGLWRYYLQYCEAGFRCGSIDVHQVTLVKEDTGEDA